MELDLEALRALAAKKHVAVNKKVSRNRHKGVEISNTQYDPRRKKANIYKYSEKQLKNYIKNLDSFVSRETQFVGGRNEKPIPAQAWKEYKILEGKRNEKILNDNNRVRDIFIKTSGMTVEARHNLMEPTRQQAGNPSVNSDWKAINREPHQIKDLNSLKKLADTLKKTTYKNYNDKQVKAGRETVAKMVEKLGAADLQKNIDGLSNKQFWLLWAHTKFMNDLSLPYHTNEESKSKDQSAMDNDVIRININKADKNIEWAKTIKLRGRL